MKAIALAALIFSAHYAAAESLNFQETKDLVDDRFTFTLENGSTLGHALLMLPKYSDDRQVAKYSSEMVALSIYDHEIGKLKLSGDFQSVTLAEILSRAAPTGKAIKVTVEREPVGLALEWNRDQ